MWTSGRDDEDRGAKRGDAPHPARPPARWEPRLGHLPPSGNGRCRGERGEHPPAPTRGRHSCFPGHGPAAITPDRHGATRPPDQQVPPRPPPSPAPAPSRSGGAVRSGQGAEAAPAACPSPGHRAPRGRRPAQTVP